MTETNATGIVRPRFSVPDGGRKHKALKRRRAYQRNAKKWLLWRDQCASGRVVAHRATEGRARPYELGDVAYALRQVASRRAVDALAWVLACERGFSGKRGVIVQHPDLAVMLGCCSKSAGDAMRELVELGLVEQRPHFVPAAGLKLRDDRSTIKARWYERTPAYATTSRCRDIVAKRDVRIARRSRSLLVGKKYQPSESAANPPGPQNKGVRGLRPEQSFVEAVLTQRRADARPAAQPVARFRGGDTTGVRHRWQPSEAELLTRGANTVTAPTKRRHAVECTCEACMQDVVGDMFASFAKHREQNGGDAAK